MIEVTGGGDAMYDMIGENEGRQGGREFLDAIYRACWRNISAPCTSFCTHNRMQGSVNTVPYRVGARQIVGVKSSEVDCDVDIIDVEVSEENLFLSVVTPEDLVSGLQDYEFELLINSLPLSRGQMAYLIDKKKKRGS